MMKKKLLNIKKNFEIRRTSKIKIIENIGKFIIEKFEKYHEEENEIISNEELNSRNNINIDNENRKKEKKDNEKRLIFSYVKFYFIKINKYLRKYKNYNYADGASFIENIKKNMDKILDETQYFDSHFIYEIIEDIESLNEIYIKALVNLIKNNYGKLIEYFSFLQYMRERDYKKIDEKLKELYNYADICHSYFEKIKNIPDVIKYTKNFIEHFKIKIEAKIAIIKYKRMNFIEKLFDKSVREELKNIYENKRLFLDEDFLNEIKKIIKNKVNYEENFNKEFQKASDFLNILKKPKDKHNLAYILKSYEPIKECLPKEYQEKKFMLLVKENIYNYREKQLNFLEKMIETYNKMENIYQEKENTSQNEEEKERIGIKIIIFREIIIYLNQLRNNEGKIFEDD